MTPASEPTARLPDLFLVGAPKAGTTALAQYLAEHPEVFASPIKEHHHLADDLAISGRPTREAYLEQYAGRAGERWALDASISYLRSEAAPRHVAEQVPGARAIVMVRNPVDAVEALYAQLLATDGEDAPSLREALRLEAERAEGRSVPPGTRHAWLHEYRSVYTYAPQLERWFDALGRDRVHVIVFDDLRDDAASVYPELLAFLDLEDDERSEFPVVNPRRRLRSPRLKSVLADPPAPVAAMGRLIPARYRLRAWRRVRDVGRRANQSRGPANRQSARPSDAADLDAVRDELRRSFAADVDQVGHLIGRDLHHWTDGEEGPRG